MEPTLKFVEDYNGKPCHAKGEPVEADYRLVAFILEHGQDSSEIPLTDYRAVRDPNVNEDQAELQRPILLLDVRRFKGRAMLAEPFARTLFCIEPSSTKNEIVIRAWFKIVS